MSMSIRLEMPFLRIFRRRSARRHRVRLRLDALRQPRRNRPQRHRGPGRRSRSRPRGRPRRPIAAARRGRPPARPPDLPTALRRVSTPRCCKAPSMGAAAESFSLALRARQAERKADTQRRRSASCTSVPLPTPRPAGLGLSALQAMAQRRKQRPTIRSRSCSASSETGPALAYAAPDGGVFNNGQSRPSGKLPPNDGLTAIYDITARMVYLPDGTKLEAHSGLGPKMDDPRHVHVRMHGATPPHVYDLVPREALFHGVRGAADASRSAARARSSGAPACSRTPICSGRTATRTAASRSRITTHSCAPTKTAR